MKLPNGEGRVFSVNLRHFCDVTALTAAALEFLGNRTFLF